MIFAVHAVVQRLEQRSGFIAELGPFPRDAILVPMAHISAERVGDPAGIGLQLRGLLAQYLIVRPLDQRIEKLILQREVRHQLSGKLPAKLADAFRLRLTPDSPTQLLSRFADLLMLLSQQVDVHAYPRFRQAYNARAFLTRDGRNGFPEGIALDIGRKNARQLFRAAGVFGFIRLQAAISPAGRRG